MAYTNDQLAALFGTSSMAELAGRGGSNVGRYGDWTANLTAQQYNDLLNQFGAISFPSSGISYNLPYSSKTYSVGGGGFNLSSNKGAYLGDTVSTPWIGADPVVTPNYAPDTYSLIWHPSLAGEAAVDAQDAASSDKEGALALGTVLALAGGAAGLFGGAAGGASATGAGATGAAAGTTASGMLAAQNAELLAMGFSPADIAAGMEGLGTAAGAASTAATDGGLWGSNMSIGDIGNYLGDQVSSGALSQEEAMQAMQAYNDAASGGAWSSYLNDLPATTQPTGALDSLAQSAKDLYNSQPVQTLKDINKVYSTGKNVASLLNPQQPRQKAQAIYQAPQTVSGLSSLGGGSINSAFGDPFGASRNLRMR